MTIVTDGYVPTLLDVTAEYAAGTTRLALAGELDVATAGRLTELVRSLPSGHRRHLRLDLSGLDFLDAAGLTALLQVRALVRDGRLVLDRPGPPVLRVLELTGMTGAFDIS